MLKYTVYKSKITVYPCNIIQIFCALQRFLKIPEYLMHRVQEGKDKQYDRFE